MSLLNQLFNRGLQASKCKTCLTFAVSRIKLLQNKRDVQLKLMRKEIAQFLQTGQEAIARIRVEHVTREQNIWAAYEILEMFCEFVIARVPILESQRECPSELCEAVATIIFAAPRCSDLPDLLHVRNLFAAKYGKEFIAAASELRPDTSVNRTIVEKLSVSTPSPQVKLKLLKEIAREYNVEWDSSKTESELSRKPEDLLNGPKQIATLSQVSLEQNSGGCQPISENSFPSTNGKQREHGPQSPAYVAKSKTPFLSTDTNNVGAVTDVRDTRSASYNNNNNNNVLERAQNAILAAERASASARAAAELVNVKFDSVKLLLEERNS